MIGPLVGSAVKVQQVIHMTEDRLAGNLNEVFRCQNKVYGVMKVFELKYELGSCKWSLWKM